MDSNFKENGILLEILAAGVAQGARVLRDFVPEKIYWLHPMMLDRQSTLHCDRQFQASIPFCGCTNGYVSMFGKIDNFLQLVALMEGAEIEDRDEAFDGIFELLNILANSIVGTLGRTIKNRFNFGVPTSEFIESSSLSQVKSIQSTIIIPSLDICLSLTTTLKCSETFLILLQKESA